MTLKMLLLRLAVIVSVLGEIDVNTGDMRRWLSVGKAVACLLMYNDQIACWGIGLSQTVPEPGMTYMTLGDANSALAHCNIKSNTALECFGFDAGSVISQMPTDTGWTTVAVGHLNACGVNSGETDPRSTCWGTTSTGIISNIPNSSTLYLMLTVSETDACGIKSNMGLECWGKNSWTTPIGSFVYVDTGESFWCALDLTGSISCGGTEPAGAYPSGPGYTDIALGNDFGCVLDSNRNASCWGTDHNSLMGQIEAKQWLVISAGYESICGVDLAWELYCYGNDQEKIVTGPWNITHVLSSVPTNSPSLPPTELPTENPTLNPTPHPTHLPTLIPTGQPTSTPTGTPTNSPSLHPTAAPTRVPTNIPTSAPTTIPTPLPTREPTKPPTQLPTTLPSLAPTTRPTERPSRTPTLQPSSMPSSQPSPVPTSWPTPNPSTSPTATPTSEPTVAPTIAPTVFPTKLPTQYPTSTPTARPTAIPTWAPTNWPTLTPTENPTERPTLIPTIRPSSSPSTNPTPSPSASPTPLPTMDPTNEPTNMPTKSPTNNPTHNPTSPTQTPSSVPTKTPTTPWPTLSPVPTVVPTKIPSTLEPTFSQTGDHDALICPANANAIMVGSRFDYWHLLLATMLMLSICMYIPICFHAVCICGGRKDDKWENNKNSLMVVTSEEVAAGGLNFSSRSLVDSPSLRLPSSGSNGEIFTIERLTVQTPIERLGSRKTASSTPMGEQEL